MHIATEEFSEKGYAKASINSIVGQLKIAKGSIFQYFGDKPGLFVFVFTISMEKVKNYLRNVRDQSRNDNLFERIEATLWAGVHFLKKHPFIYKLYTRILFESDVPYRQEILISLRRNSLEYIRSLLEAARDKGEIPLDLDLEKTSFLLDAIMDRFLQAQSVQHLDAGLGLYNADLQETELWIKHIVGFIRDGIQAAKARSLDT